MANRVTLQSEGKPFPVDENLRPLKIGGKSSSLELSQHENGSGARITGGLEVNGTGKSIVAEPLITNNINSTDDLTLDVNGGIVLDSSDGEFAVKKAGVEFSVASSAYAGTILGYRMIGEGSGRITYTLTTSFVVPDDDLGIRFIAPPSGVVEIMVQLKIDPQSNNATHVGLSDANATSGYNTLGATYEQVLAVVDETDQGTVQHYWVVTSLTAGNTYNYWLGVKKNTSGIGNGFLNWGGTSTEEHCDFIMKATALPAATSDFAEYD